MNTELQIKILGQVAKTLSKKDKYGNWHGTSSLKHTNW